MRFHFHEVIDTDFTAVRAEILCGARVIAEYRNFDPQTVVEEMYANQSEQFALPDEPTARLFLESSGAYWLVK
jgi:hypothetical protein